MSEISELIATLRPPFDNDRLLRKKKSIKRQLLEQDINWVEKKIAILTGSTANEIMDQLEISLLSYGIKPSFYLSEYNKYFEDAVFGTPELDEFAPDIVFIFTTSRNVLAWPNYACNDADCEELLNSQFMHLKQCWEALRARYGCTIIQNNFDRPWYRLLGNKDIYDVHGKSNFIYKLNGKIYDYANTVDNFYINDIDYLASSYGLANWHNFDMWYLYKYALDLKAIPALAFNVANIIKAIYGKNKKAFALDLDNTLWGGVISEDGVNNIEIGNETQKAEAYKEFQEYISEHKNLGIVLTVDSKNDMEIALEGLNHPDSTLTPNDFAVIKANWEPKDVNLVEIAKDLNIGADAIVFVDDNPFERNIVKSTLPDAGIPEVGEVGTFISTIDSQGYFETVSITKEDIEKNQMFKEQTMRKQAEATFTDYNKYLESLNMVATISDFAPEYLQRIAQLTNKSNQFNVTTKRYSQAEIDEVYNSDEYIRLAGRLEDKFGDNGLVSVMIGKKKQQELHMDLWIMSCRVLKRDFEYAMFDSLVEECRKQGIEKIVGYYYPTPKNSMVKNLYQSVGAVLRCEDADGNAVWDLDVSTYVNKNKVLNDIRR